MTSNNETVSPQNLWVGNIAKSMTSEGNNALLPANVDHLSLLQGGLMNSSFQKFPAIYKSQKDWSFRKQLILFPSNLNVFWGKVEGIIIIRGRQNGMDQLFSS